MKWIIDTTGRFEWRPYYDQEELDNECEQIVSQFLRSKNGLCRFPISTDDLTIMIEQDTSDLDLYADLSNAGEDVEGVTDFFPHKKPAVRIDQELSLDSSKNDRLRTTLAHEYGHVKFHSFLWNFNPGALSVPKIPKKLSAQHHKYHLLSQKFSPRYDSYVTHSNNNKTSSCFMCTKTYIFDAPVSDWMEWQASYVCGAILMPVSPLRDIAQKNIPKQNHAWVPTGSNEARELISCIAGHFEVSPEAARTRLLKLGILQSMA